MSKTLYYVGKDVLSMLHVYHFKGTDKQKIGTISSHELKLVLMEVDLVVKRIDGFCSEHNKDYFAMLCNSQET